MEKLGERARKYEYSECTELTIYEDMYEVKTAPAVDAVEVVRCKDCKHFADTKGKDSGKPMGYGQCKQATGIRGIVCADDYCSYGERRTEG